MTIEHGKKANLKAFAKVVGQKSFSFGTADELKTLLNLTPGSISPLGLMYDTKHIVSYYFDADLLKASVIYIHPNLKYGHSRHQS